MASQKKPTQAQSTRCAQYKWPSFCIRLCDAIASLGKRKKTHHIANRNAYWTRGTYLQRNHAIDAGRRPTVVTHFEWWGGGLLSHTKNTRTHSKTLHAHYTHTMLNTGRVFLVKILRNSLRWGGAEPKCSVGLHTVGGGPQTLWPMRIG